MARNSKKGACSANVQAAKSHCLMHNRREGKIPSYINPHLTHLNRVVYEVEELKGIKSLLPMKKQRIKLYEEKVRQKCQAKFTPFREDALRLKAGITDEQLLAFKEKVEKQIGWRVPINMGFPKVQQRLFCTKLRLSCTQLRLFCIKNHPN